MIPSRQSGLTLIEVLIATAIASVVAVGLFNIFNATLKIFSKGEAELQHLQNHGQIITVIDTQLASAKQILQVSQNTNPTGYIQYQDIDDDIVSIFTNTHTNRSLFASNTEATANIMIHYANSDILNVLVDNVSSFNITTYAESANFFRVASANNTSSSTDTDAITSIRIRIVKNGGNTDPIERLVTLGKTRFDQAGSQIYGSDLSTIGALFASTFSTQNIDIMTENSSSTADGARIPTQAYTVKILGTGRYYQSINAAIDAATSHDVIAVAQKYDGSPYIEAITLPSTITLRGGYNPITWAHTPHLTPSRIQPLSGIVDETIVMGDHSSAEHLLIDGNHLINGIVAENIDHFHVHHCDIINVDQGVRISNSSGVVENVAVTANEHGAIITSNTGKDVFIRRSRWSSVNQAQKPNFLIQNSDRITVENNLIIKGQKGLVLDNVNNSTIANNVITNAEEFGLLGDNIAVGNGLTIINNILFDHDIGIYMTPNGADTLSYNFIGHNQSGFTAGNFITITSDPPGALAYSNTNIIDETAYTWGSTDPYFDNISTYTLDSEDTVLSDGGDPEVDYNDLYTNGPGQDNSRNDIGAYGGPEAGRIGAATYQSILVGSNPITTLDAAWPGDQYILGSGSHTWTSTLALRKKVSLWGESLDDVIIDNSANPAIQIGHDQSVIETLQIRGDGGDNGINVSNTNDHHFRHLLIKDSHTGINLSNSIATITHCTLHSNIVGIAASGASTSANIRFSIFSDNTTLGIQESGTAETTFYHSYFSNNSTDHSGTLSTIPDPILSEESPLYFDVSMDNFYLHPSSNAIDSFSHHDMGAFDYSISTGNLLSDSITSTLNRQYKSIAIAVSGEAGDIPVVDAIHSQIDVAYTIDGSTFDLGTVATITSNAISTINIPLSPRSIGTTFQVSTTLKSYRVNRSPWINRIQITY